MKRLISVFIACIIISSFFFTTNALADMNVSVKVIIEAEWDNMGYAGEGIFSVQNNGKWGFIDSNGKVIAEPKWDEVGDFHDGLARVSIYTDSIDYGESACANVFFIDKSGNVVLTIPTDEWESVDSSKLSIINYKEDVISYSYAGLDGTYFADKSGNILLVIPTSNTRIAEGLIASPIYEGITNIKELSTSSGVPIGYSYVNIKGDIIINKVFEDVRPFNQGLAPAKMNGKWGFIDKTGEFIIQPLYDDFYTANYDYHYNIFNDGLACVSIDGFVGVDASVGIIDKTGKVVHDYVWDGINTYINGYAAAFMTNERGEYILKAFINTSGELLNKKSDWADMGSFYEGIAAVKIDNKWGFINSNGELIIAPKYDVYTRFNKGVSFVKHDDEVIIIDKSGNTVTNQSWKWDSIYGFTHDKDENYVAFQQNNKWGLVHVEVSTSTSPTETPSITKNGDTAINGKEIKLNTQMKILNTSIMLPLREICELMGMSVSYDSSTKTAILSKDNRVVTHKIGSNDLTINSKQAELDTLSTITYVEICVPSTLIGESTMVCVDMMEEVINAKIDCDVKLNTITITSK